MVKIVAAAAFSMAFCMLTVVGTPRAELALLEIEIDEKGSILEVRAGDGQPLERAPFGKLEGFDLVTIKSLLVSRAVGTVGGELATCCRRSGVWRACTTLAETILVDYDGQVIQDPGEEEVTIESAVVEAAKSHVLLLVEDEAGDRHGMVVSDDGTWYGPKEFAPPQP